MTVSELLKRMTGAYASFDAKAAAAFAAPFRARLQRHEGEALERAYDEVLASWRPRQGQRFPVPADFEEHLPGRLDLPKDSGPKLDFAARNKRAAELFREWREGQGKRAANGNPKLMKALEEMAQPIALMMGFEANPKPLLLSRKDVRIAYQRAISFERLARHGALPAAPGAWWSQIAAIAGEWGLSEVTPAWWSEAASKALDRKEAA